MFRSFERRYTGDGWNDLVDFEAEFLYATDVLEYVKSLGDGRCWYVTGYRQTAAGVWLVFFEADDAETSAKHFLDIAVRSPENPSDPECPPRLSVRRKAASPS